METDAAWPPRVEAMAPLSRAWDHARRILFPFDFGLWITLGFVAFLSSLGQGGGFNFASSFNRATGAGTGAPPEVRNAIAWVEGHVPLVTLIGGIVFVLAIALMALVLHLRARGIFMYLEVIYTGRVGRIGEMWRRAGDRSRSFWYWSMILAFAFWAVVLVIAGAALAALWPALRSGNNPSEGFVIAGAVCGACCAAVVMLLFGLAHWVLNTFLAPILYVRGGDIPQAWDELLHMTAGNWSAFFLLLVAQAAIGVFGGILTMLVCLFTCCMGMFPVIHQTILQPYYFWVRSIGPFFLAQYGGPYVAAFGLSAATPAHPADAPTGPAAPV